MSKKDEIASGAEHDDQNTDSVYDFLYHDARRIGSFLAQFDNLGHLRQVTSSETAAKDAKRGYSLKVGGSLPVPGSPEGAEGGITFGVDPSQSGSEALARVYDPLWSNALTLLDCLDAKGLIQRDVSAARLGQFVIASGELSILNAAMLPKMWANAAIRDVWVRHAVETAKLQLKSKPRIDAVKQAVRERSEQAALKEAEATARSGIEVLPLFPHSPQCVVKGKDFSVWSTLGEEGMVGTVSDLSLKHGTDIPGEWHLLGVLDALPSPIPAQSTGGETGVAAMANLIKNLSNLGRTILGRPPDAFGMTALLLFREVATSTRKKE
jgi:hypothetical protein